jgi:hypothetical protein
MLCVVLVVRSYATWKRYNLYQSAGGARRNSHFQHSSKKAQETGEPETCLNLKREGERDKRNEFILA